MDYSATLNNQPMDASVAALVLASIGLIVALCLFVWILFIIAYWKMFTKAGEKGWKSIIPIYNTYVAFRLSWKDGAKAFWIYLISAIVTCCFSGSTSVDGTTTQTNPVFAVIALAASIVCLIWYIRVSIKMAHAYNKSTACGVLSIFFPNIMALYYGFANSATYQGPQD